MAVPSGFPESYFIIQSVGSDYRVLDVRGGKHDDGTEIIVYPDTAYYSKKNPRLRKDAESQNQVFFIDENGILRSKASGNAVGFDSESNQLVLRRVGGGPSSELPTFSYSKGEIHVHIQSQKKKYLMVAHPMSRHAPHILQNLAFFGIAHGITEPARLANSSGEYPPPVKPPSVDWEGPDDSPNKMREVGVIDIEDKEIVEKVKDRRIWVVKAVELMAVPKRRSTWPW
ncbi:WD40 repeat-like protein [Moniliophthora roreri]|uniref:Uncharacterized protein n=1 Tax=Moniliophthora roreri TaxID=221103 RepID=A0A0W0G4K9_MONRR|nr:WD40 repeat-like protein [Moniliophthora roreri]